MGAVFGGHGAGHHHRAGRNFAVTDLAGFAVQDARALADEHAHGDDRAFAHPNAFHHLAAGADEAIIFDDGGGRLQGFENAADADPAGEVHAAADLRAGAHRRPGVHHGARADVGADVDITRHQDDIRGDVGAFADVGRGHDAKLAAGEILAGVIGELEGNFVVVTGHTAANDAVFFNAKRKQHRHLEPLIDLPAAADWLGHPHLAGIQQRQGVVDRLAHRGGDIVGLDFGALLPGFKDGLFDFGYGLVHNFSDNLIDSEASRVVAHRP